MDDTWDKIIEELQAMPQEELIWRPHRAYPDTKTAQADWYQNNKERILKERKQYTMDNKEEINRKRRERRNTEPYRSQYLARQRERRRNK